MEALWNLEDKWNVTTQEAVALLLFACTAFAVIGLCAATMLKRKAQRKPTANRDSAASDASMSITWSDTHQRCSNNWARIRRVLMESMRWSEAKRWEEETLGERSPPQPLLGLGEYESSSRSSVGWQSLNSVSPVWQRPILMGEKCEFPRFSGLILYDERGRLLDHSLASSHEENIDQEKPAAALRTTLRDLL